MHNLAPPCIFPRLRNHYSPNNNSTISYELFLDKLGFGDSCNFKIAPVCAKIGMNTPILITSILISSEWTR